ncbi:hypothetical protein P171DRAFT_480596 [Karstenula rhodostoma CBS 690.94]|uniref:Uncharacterized protein n=1 Tax=Karstenula rhodostoma CBS 690.94 TaxID=1392251 RepID=A0A9P4PSR6_9PLEO|nr:hypothetical protein P171DRAFT_480596 [Karstenula rhodostoma CBS 690.94]
MSPRSRSPATTHYEFIAHTGIEDASAKQNLKTVRSHVMRNYLHQQQRQSGQSSKSAVSERRQSKQRARSSRSASKDTDAWTTPGTASDPQNQFALGCIGSFDVSLGVAPHRAESNPFLGYVPQQDVVSCLAQSYVTCVMRDKKDGFLQPSLDTLNAKGETMRVVQETLEMCGSDVPDTILFAIHSLAYGCSTNHEWVEAVGHIEALQRLVETRGGMHHMEFDLQRILTYSSLFIAAELLLPPQFPLPLYPNSIPFNLAFQDDAQIRAWRTVKRFPKNNSFVFDVVVRMHQLGLAATPDWTDKIDKRALSNLYFEAMHSAMLVQLEEPWHGQLQSGAQGREVSIMFKVWAAGLPIFVSAALRHLKLPQGSNTMRYYHGPIFGRIKAILDDNGGHHAWPRGKNLEPILATLFYALEALTWDDPWRTYCLHAMRKVSNILKLKNTEDFKKVLDFFPTTATYQDLIYDVWAQITSSSVPSTLSCVLQDSS